MKNLTLAKVIVICVSVAACVFFISDCTKHAYDRGYDPAISKAFELK